MHRPLPCFQLEWPDSLFPPSMTLSPSRVFFMLVVLICYVFSVFINNIFNLHKKKTKKQGKQEKKRMGFHINNYYIFLGLKKINWGISFPNQLIRSFGNKDLKRDLMESFCFPSFPLFSFFSLYFFALWSCFLLFLLFLYCLYPVIPSASLLIRFPLVLSIWTIIFLFFCGFHEYMVWCVLFLLGIILVDFFGC